MGENLAIIDCIKGVPQSAGNDLIWLSELEEINRLKYHITTGMVGIPCTGTHPSPYFTDSYVCIVSEECGGH